MPQNVRNIEVDPQSLQLRADFTPESYNAQSRTIEVTFATETPVPMYNWRTGERFWEILDISSEAMRSGRLDAGAPVLDNHRQWGGVNGVLGSVISHRIQNRKAIATLKMSRRDEIKPVLQDIQDGVLRGISVGYRVLKYEDTGERGENNWPIYRAVDWEPREISFAPIQADIESGTRNSSDPDGRLNVELINTNTMPENNSANNERNQQPAAPSAAPAAQPAAPAAQPAQVRTEAPAAPAAAPAEAPLNEAQIRTAERERIAQIRNAARVAGIEDQEFIQGAIDNGRSLANFHQDIFTRMAAEDSTPENSVRNVRVTADETDQAREAIADAIQLRSNPNVVLSADAPTQGRRVEAARSYRGMRLVDIARECLDGANVSVRGMNPMQIVQAACGFIDGNRAHTTTDFPLLLGTVFRRTLRAAYQARPRTFTQWARRGTMPDFRPQTKAQLSGIIGDLDKIPENGEYKMATVSESGETYSIGKYGKKIGFSWESMVNDDLDFLSRIPQALANKVAQNQSNLVYAVLTGNPLMADGFAVFSNEHNNLLNGGGIDKDTLNLARQAIRDQTEPNGDVLNLEPRFLLVGSGREMEARQMTSSSFLPQTQGEINPWVNSFIPIVEPRLGTKWFVAADPASVDTVEYSFLAGEDEVVIMQREGFDIDGMEMKVRSTFGVKAIDFRGLAYNPGS